MRTRSTSRWLLTAPLLLALVLPVLRGQAAGDNLLVAAAKDDDIRAVRALIVARVSVNEPARDGSTALLWAAYHSNVEMARALIAAGAKVDTPNQHGITPLLQASRTGDTAIMQALIRARANLARTHPDGETPLMAAAQGEAPAGAEGIVCRLSHSQIGDISAAIAAIVGIRVQASLPVKY